MHPFVGYKQNPIPRKISTYANSSLTANATESFDLTLSQEKMNKSMPCVMIFPRLHTRKIYFQYVPKIKISLTIGQRRQNHKENVAGIWPSLKRELV